MESSELSEWPYIYPWSDHVTRSEQCADSSAFVPSSIRADRKIRRCLTPKTSATNESVNYTNRVTFYLEESFNHQQLPAVNIFVSIIIYIRKRSHYGHLCVLVDCFERWVSTKLRNNRWHSTIKGNDMANWSFWLCTLQSIVRNNEQAISFAMRKFPTQIRSIK